MVTSDNHNKYYRMIPCGDTFKVEFGRVGAGCQTTSYPIYQWQKKYNEKLRKGYVDQTDLSQDLVTIRSKQDEYKEIQDPDILQLVNRLQSMAKQAVNDNYTISSNKVTMAMVDKAQEIIISLFSIKNVEDFNQALISLFTVIPRKMYKVSKYLASNDNDFAKIIQREQDLLDVMKGQVIQEQTETSKKNTSSSKTQTILEFLGIDIAKTNAEDINLIKRCLGNCADKFYKAWKTSNTKTQSSFDHFIKDNNIRQTKLLWHGSRNENWWSIINSGLMLKPSAVITGKMFGYGTYFATKAQKSLGYTSLKGSYWVSGNSSSAFMGLYDVAYGKPYDVYSFNSKYYDFNYDKLQKVCPGANCLHAHAGSMLRNDEIIVYKEEQTTIRYLVELR